MNLILITGKNCKINTNKRCRRESDLFDDLIETLIYPRWLKCWHFKPNYTKPATFQILSSPQLWKLGNSLWAVSLSVLKFLIILNKMITSQKYNYSLIKVHIACTTSICTQHFLKKVLLECTRASSVKCCEAFFTCIRMIWLCSETPTT